MTICTRPGCGVDFDVASNQGPCTFHPGAPVFHEGSKSWSCCRDRNKPVLEFDEFMLIGGCTREEKHTNEKRAKTTFSKTTARAEDEMTTNASTAAVPSLPNSITPMSSSRVAAIERQNEQRSGKSTSSTGEATWVEEEDPTNVAVAEGTQCKRTGCKATFDGGDVRDRTKEECQFHRGVPIFHEGSKGYACCKRRVLEFDEFLTIEPCTRAKSGHLFVGRAEGVAEDDEQEERVDCRIDHYETPNDVRVTVYAKGVEMNRSTIAFQAEQIEFSLGLPVAPNGSRPRRYMRNLLPYAEIDAEASSFTVSRFKIDLVLVKRHRGESWPALERGDQALGYGLTFGRKLDA